MILSRFLEFWTLQSPGVLWVLLGSVLLGASAGLIGCFAFLRKQSLVGDALAHAALPGVTSAYLLFHSRDPVVLLLGAGISCALGYFTIQAISRFSKIKSDSALAIVLSLFFAVGIFQLTIIQRLPFGSQAGLDKLLFGQAASLVKTDVQLLGSLALAVIAFTILFFKPLRMLSFDKVFAFTTGVNVAFYEIMLATAIVVSVVIGLQLVGVVLMAALLLTPAASARYWTNDLRTMCGLAALFGALSGVAGANISYLAPRMPTGPWMVVAITIIFLISLLFAPNRGLLHRELSRRKMRKKIAEENVLRTLYKMAEDAGDQPLFVEPTAILSYRKMSLLEIESVVERLVDSGLIEEVGGKVGLTDGGWQKAAQLTRFHRLWELYLLKNINIAADHVHADAEEVEHIMTPELESMLLEELPAEATEATSESDPHGREIPGGVTKE